MLAGQSRSLLHGCVQKNSAGSSFAPRHAPFAHSPSYRHAAPVAAVPGAVAARYGATKLCCAASIRS